MKPSLSPKVLFLIFCRYFLWVSFSNMLHHYFLFGGDTATGAMAGAVAMAQAFVLSKNPSGQVHRRREVPGS